MKIIIKKIGLLLMVAILLVGSGCESDVLDPNFDLEPIPNWVAVKKFSFNMPTITTAVKEYNDANEVKLGAPFTKTGTFISKQESVSLPQAVSVDTEISQHVTLPDLYSYKINIEMAVGSEEKTIVIKKGATTVKTINVAQKVGLDYDSDEELKCEITGTDISELAGESITIEFQTTGITKTYPFTVTMN